MSAQKLTLPMSVNRPAKTAQAEATFQMPQIRRPGELPRSRVNPSMTPPLEGMTPSLTPVGQPLLEGVTTSPVVLPIINNTPGSLKPAVDSEFIVTVSQGPLTQMSQANSALEVRPVPAEVRPVPAEVRPSYNALVERLMKNGYLVQYVMYEGARPVYFLVRTRLGDRALVELDESVPASPVPTNSVTLERIERTTVPQEIRLGISRCLDYDICGASFVCNDTVCISTPQREDNYKMTPGVISDTGAHPVVTLSEVLTAPDRTENVIEEANRSILVNNLTRWDARIEEAERKLKELTDGVSERLVRLNTEIGELTQAYRKISDVDPDQLTNELQADYYTILKLLAEKKQTRQNLIDRLNSVPTLIQPIGGLIEESNVY